jgi:hypothetical protein
MADAAQAFEPEEALEPRPIRRLQQSLINRIAAGEVRFRVPPLLCLF